MFPITPSAIPESALLNKFLERGSHFAGSYVDCYSTEMDRNVGLGEFVIAFYTTPLFKLERVILRLLSGKPSSDQDATDLARGDTDRFAAWVVEERAPGQLLMCDTSGRTRSWFMVEPGASTTGGRTLLRFGSAVVARRNGTTGEPELGRAFELLLGFHRLYSRLLLRSAAAKLNRPSPARDTEVP